MECDAADIVAYYLSLRFMPAGRTGNGKHVFVEKPMCESMQEANELVKLGERSRYQIPGGTCGAF